MKITPVKGTNDYLPAQAELRNYLHIMENNKNVQHKRFGNRKNYFL